MKQYIDKDALVAEIEKAISELLRNYNPNPLGNRQDCIAAVEIEALNLIIYSLDALKVKEVDLEKELQSFFYPHVPWGDYCKNEQEDIKEWSLKIAKHFFELGFNSRKK